MTEPRRILPGATYLVTRRCCQRAFRLRPSHTTSQVFLYCLALAAEKTGVLFHGICVMSNHHHLVVTDPHALLPDFLRELHRLTSKAMNAAQGQWANLWSAEHCHVETLADESAMVEAIAYVAANPVAAGLVERPEFWPGVTVWRPATIHVARPSVYFHPNGTCPDRLALRVTYPEAGTPRTEGAWARRIGTALEQRVAEAHAKMRKQGRAFLGRAAVLAQSVVARASSPEPKRSHAQAVAVPDTGARRQLMRALRAFRSAYRSAVTQWRNGVRSVAFPYGTWLMVRQHAADVAPPLVPG